MPEWLNTKSTMPQGARTRNSVSGIYLFELEGGGSHPYEGTIITQSTSNIIGRTEPVHLSQHMLCTRQREYPDNSRVFVIEETNVQ